MLTLVIGIVAFLGVHTLPTRRQWRAKQIARFGLQTYKGLYSLAALLAFALLVWGFSRYRAEGLIVVWTPPIWTRPLAILLMWAAFVAFACMNPAPGRIRGWLRHPMLIGVMIWALAHLLANGDAGGMLLFASFLLWAAYDRISVATRGDLGAAPQSAFARADALALAIGTLAYAAVIFLHPWLFGVSPIGWT